MENYQFFRMEQWAILKNSWDMKLNFLQQLTNNTRNKTKIELLTHHRIIIVANDKFSRHPIKTGISQQDSKTIKVTKNPRPSR